MEQVAIPAERIPGPVLLLCGDHDLLWVSCTYADLLAHRRGKLPYTELREPGAGHYVGDPVPNRPITPTLKVGGTQQDDALGRLDAWPKVLAFLRKP
jgi:hypothetical protein